MKYYLIIIISLFLFSCQEDCENLKIGTFNLIGKNGTIFTIVREKNIQTEYSNNSKIIIQYDINWTSNCTYEIFNRKLISETDYNTKHSDTLKFEIIKIEGNKHIVQSKFKDIEEVYENTLTKIK
jgi:hypothetical protein